MFPTPEELQERMAEAEVGLFLSRGTVDESMVATAWYLHAVGSSLPSLDLYPLERRARANQVASHIFDLALSTGDRPVAERLEMTFAAQIGYLRGGLDPNALALYRRATPSAAVLRDAPGEASLEIGSALLALDRRRLFARIDTLRSEADEIGRAVGVSDLIETPYGSAARVIEGCSELIIHLTYNRPERLERARDLFSQAIHPQYALADLDSRWVAAHLRDIADDLGTSSVWAQLPPSVPPSAARAMTLGDPPVLCLWPPQRELLAMIPSPLGPDLRRLVLSFPTSAGKTLIAQYIVTAHIAAARGSVCVVAPTHSLGRELQRDLDRRLGTLGSGAADAGPLGVPLPDGPPVVVMTPEKFAAHLRTEPDRMLSDFSLFIIDEAHLVGDSERGWVLESALGFIHEATRGTSHRVILLSAALGNRSHVCSWLGLEDGPATAFHNDWRGPRRAHALLGTSADWDRAELVPKGPRARIQRRNVPLHGEIHIRTGPGKHHSLRTTQPIGKLSQALRDGVWTKDNEGSDPAYRSRARMVTVLGSQGSVLVVEPTKIAAQRTAAALADEIEEEDPACFALSATVASRLGPSHPLVSVLRRGVGFHHAALPSDVQAELEDGVRHGPLRYLVATTTLIEGVNFPVRSVLVGDRGYRTTEGYVTTLDAAKLLNAIGRAGRAGRETEGWVVLWLNEEFISRSFEALAADDEALTASSHLSTPDALEALAEFEDLIRRGEDAVLEAAGTPVSDFISHVWFIATALRDLRLVTSDPVTVSIESTLAWQQLSPTDQARWHAVATLAVQRYELAPPEQRQRWARTGTSLRTAAILEGLVSELRLEIQGVADRSDPVEAFRLVAREGRLGRLLSLAEARTRPFRPRRNSPASAAIDVDLQSLIIDWLRGDDLDDLGERYLAAVAEETYRYEQLSEFVSQVLEHLLPWLLTTVVAWVNDGLAEDAKLCPELPAFLRFGVDSEVALELARGGIRSRRLVHAVADVASSSMTLSVKEWLAEFDVRSWGTQFEASPSELADLLLFARVGDARITSRVLSGETVELPLASHSEPADGVVELREADEPHPARLAVYRGEEAVGFIGSGHHDDVARLLAIGVPLRTELRASTSLRVWIDDPAARSAWFVDSSAST